MSETNIKFYILLGIIIVGSSIAGIGIAQIIIQSDKLNPDLQVSCNDDLTRCHLINGITPILNYHGIVVNGIYFPSGDWEWDIEKGKILLQDCSVYVSKEVFPCLEEGVYLG